MVRGGEGNGQLGKKNKLGVREKMKKVKEKNYIKKGEKDLKNASLGYKLKKK